MKSGLLLLGVAAALSLLPCLALIIRKHVALRRADQYQGTVVSHVERGKNDSSYALKIAYEDRDGIAHEYTTLSSSSPPARNIGAPVTVFHHRDGSRDVLVFQHLYFGYWLWLCLATFITGCVFGSSILSRIYLR